MICKCKMQIVWPKLATSWIQLCCLWPLWRHCLLTLNLTPQEVQSTTGNCGYLKTHRIPTLLLSCKYNVQFIWQCNKDISNHFNIVTIFYIMYSRTLNWQRIIWIDTASSVSQNDFSDDYKQSPCICKHKKARNKQSLKE